MLRYSFTINKNEVDLREVEWSERYVAQDLSFFSGVTSPTYHLEDINRIYVEYSKDESRAPFEISAKTVDRLGYIVLKNKAYNVMSGSTVFYSGLDDGGSSASTYNFKYIDFNGMHKIITDEVNEVLSAVTDGGSVLIQDVLTQYSVGKIVEKDIEVEVRDNKCEIDTVLWVEDGKVTIDGKEYVVDFDSFSSNGSLGALIDEYGNYVMAEDTCKCGGMSVCKYDKAEEVTKFIAIPSDFQSLDVDYVTTYGYENFIVYDDERYIIKKKYDNNGGWEYICYGDIFNGGESRVIISIDVSGETYATKDNICSSATYEMMDLTYFESYVKINNEKVMVQSTIVEEPFGHLLAMHLKGHYNDMKIGDKIVGTFNCGESEIRVVSYVNGSNDTLSDRYVIYNGTKYEIEDGLIKKIDTSGDSSEKYYYIEEFSVSGDALVRIDDELVPMSANTSHTKVKRYGNIVISNGSTSTARTYNVVSADGVEIFGERYEVFSATSSGQQATSSASEEEGVFNEYIEIKDKRRIVYNVVDIIGSSLLICEAFIDDNIIDKGHRLEYDVESASFGTANQNDAVFKKLDESLYYSELTPSVVYKYWFNGNNSIYDDILKENLVIHLNNAYATLRVPMIMQGGDNPLQDNITENDFFISEKKKSINDIVDMEKDVYTPKILDREDEDDTNPFKGSKEKYKPIYELDFNLHFRTRDLDTWKVLEDEEGTKYGWFTTDYYPYNSVSGKELMEVSDLYGLMGFRDIDVLYQKSNLSHSFLRLSYYDSTNPQTQSLLATSCVFVDGSAAFKKYMDNSRKVKDSYVKVGYGEATDKFSNKINLSSERSNDEEKYDDNTRMSSRLKVLNKYETKGSSEGFYIYIFREYSSGLYPKQIFMKAEFNHAGIGRIIPMIIPMKWEESSDIYYPTSALTFDEISSDADYGKNGYPIEAVSSQSYIPLYAVFDYDNKEYGYVFDDRYVTVGEDGIARLNLFELKIKDESKDETAKNTYKINVNKKFKQQ